MMGPYITVCTMLESQKWVASKTCLISGDKDYNVEFALVVGIAEALETKKLHRELLCGQAHYLPPSKRNHYSHV